MTRFCLAIPLLMFAGSVVGQDYTEIDSLVNKLELAEGKEKINFMLDLAWEYGKSHPDSTIYYAEKSIDYYNQMGFSSGIAQAYNYIGVAYHYKGDNLVSFDYYTKAIDESIVHNDSVQYAHSLNSLGRMYLTQGSFLKAYEHYFNALEIFQKYNDAQGVGYCYKSLSELYQTQHNYEKALEMSQQSYRIRVETGNVRGQISILEEIASIYQMMGNFDRAFDYYLQAKIKAESIDDQINIANINIGIADLYYSDSKYDEALIFAKKALKTAGKTNNLNLLNKINLQLGKLYYAQNNYKESIGYLQNVVNNSERSQELAHLKDAHYYLSLIYQRRENLPLALGNYTKFAEIQQKLDNAEVARTIEKFESRIEIEKREQENALLLANQAKDQAIIERQRIQNIALIAIVLIVFVLGINLYITSRKRRRDNLRLVERNERIAAQTEEIASQNNMINKQNKELQQNVQELEKLNVEKDTLMNIVAHDLKSPFSRINGLIELLKLSKPNDEQKSYIALLEDISKGSISLIRDLLDVNAFEEDKRKPEYTKIDIHEVLLEKTKSFYSDAKSKGIKIHTPTVENHICIKSDKTYLSRILDNLISNAIKFSSNDSQVELRAGHANDHIFFSIKDEGQGFSEEDKAHLYEKFHKLSARPTAGESSNGLGLAIVKNLVERLNAEISLKSELGKGSEFIIKFPSSIEVITEKI